MRQYRGRRKDNNQWVNGYLMSPNRIMVWDKDICMRSESYLVIPSSVSQSTGNFDKNGNEIFGGDKYKDANGIISIVKMAVDGWALFPIKKGTPVRNLYWHNVCIKTQGEIIPEEKQ